MNDPAQSGPTFPLIAGVMNYLGGVVTGERTGPFLVVLGLVAELGRFPGRRR